MDKKILEGKKREAVDKMRRKKRKLLTAEREYRIAKSAVEVIGAKLGGLEEPKPEPIKKRKRTYTYKPKKKGNPLECLEEKEAEKADDE